MDYAPIIVFAFNRPDSLKCTIDSLLHNKESKFSDLYIFVDGARENCPAEKEDVGNVQEYVKSIKGFKTISYTFSKKNRGLGASVIAGITEVINKHQKVIVLEDDLIVSPCFLSFMNESLNFYKNDESIFSICGYTNKIAVPSAYEYDAYFCTRSSSWGWGTWKNRWDTIDWELKDWDTYSKSKKTFNKWGGSDCFGMLSAWKEGLNNSWAIRFCFSQFLQKKLSLFPVISKVKNNGFDGKGTNCKKYNRFKCVFDTRNEIRLFLPTHLSIDRSFYKSAMSYHSLYKRIISRLIYTIQDK